MGSHQLAAWHGQHWQGATCSQQRPFAPQQQQQPSRAVRAAHQVHSQQPLQAWAGADWQPAPPPRWRAEPLSLLAHLPEVGSPYLASRPPATDAAPTMVVRLHLDQVSKPAGQQMALFRKDLEGLLFRKGVQQPNSTTLWAATHRSDKDLACIEVSVQDTAAARQAARETVELGYVAVAGLRVPATYGRHTGPPAGCTVVTVHQLPVALGRQGCVEVLLKAAQQAGDVVCEFLGGSRTMGDAAMSCPAADTVVAWVRAPEDDPLLTSLPSSIPVHGGPAVRIEVGGRPSQEPERWPGLTAECIAARDAAMQAAARHGTQQQPPPASQPRGSWNLPDSLDAEAPLPPGQQPRQQRQRQRNQGGQRPAGQLHTASAAAGAAAGGPAAGGSDVAMQEAEAHSPGVQRPGGSLQPAPATTAGDDAGATWLAGQLQFMVQDAARIADEVEFRIIFNQIINGRII